MKVRVKICGITHPDDAAAAVAAGADMVGLNFVPASKRCLRPDAAERIAERVAGQVERVAVFSNAPWVEIERVVQRVEVERVQLHGEETEEEVEMLDHPVIKALRGADPAAAHAFPGALLLLDHPAGGGRGEAWDWSAAAPLVDEGIDLILAGGLTPDNVERALESLGGVLPWGVDVASGVESGDGRKDPARMRAFVEAVRRAESSG